MLKIIEKLRLEFSNKDVLSQKELDSVHHQIKQYKVDLMPEENDEQLVLVDSLGNRTGLFAPRWMCHLLNLRHLCIHVLIQWKNPQYSEVFIFQIRSWSKFDCPGHIDISVSGHVTDDMEIEKSAFKEMHEELGLSEKDLIGSKIHHCTSYEKYNENKKKHFYNREWTEVYMGEISTHSLESIKFNDSEVIGIYLCPKNELSKLLSQNQIPIAPSLKSTFKNLVVDSF